MATDAITASNPYQKGRDAFDAGKKRTENPCTLSDDKDRWDAGWRDAKWSARKDSRFQNGVARAEAAIAQRVGNVDVSDMRRKVLNYFKKMGDSFAGAKREVDSMDDQEIINFYNQLDAKDK